MDFAPMLSTGFRNDALPSAALVIGCATPLRRSPRMMLTATLSSRLSAAVLAASGPIGPMLMSGTGTIMPPAGTARSFTRIDGRNWKVMSSIASALLSTWISYTASGSRVK